jgi:outer membrane protein W
MKKTALITLLLGMVVFSSAFAAGKMTFGVNGGVVVPTGDFGDFAEMGFQGGVYGDYMVNEQFGVGLGVGYVTVDAKDEYLDGWKALAELAGVVDYTVDICTSIIPVTLHGKWFPPMKDSKVAPYVVAGGGMYMMTSKWDETGTLEGEDIGSSHDETETKAGIFGGAGVDFKASPQVKVGVFATMHDIFTDGTSTMYFNAGVNVGFGLGGK